jgi:hypothetical protein
VSTTHEIAGTVTSVSTVPGALDLLEKGELDYADVRFGDVAPAGPIRRGAGGQAEDAARWRAFLDRLRGYQRESVVMGGEPFWVPVAELVAPEGVRATCRTTASRSQSMSLRLDIAGSGFGNGLRTTLATDLSFTCEVAPLQLAVQLRITATRYVAKRGPAIMRVDVDSTAKEVRLETAEREQLPDPLLPPLFELVRRVDLNAVRDPGTCTWAQRLERETSWSVALGAAFPQLGSSSVSLSLSGVKETEVAFELPYGRDYLIYRRSDRSSLLPRCAIAPPP